MKEMIVWFIWTLVISIVIGGGLAYYRDDHKSESTIMVKEKIGNVYVEGAKVQTFPKLELKYNHRLSGKAVFIYKTEEYMPVFIRVKAEGYETVTKFVILNADKPTEIRLIEKGAEKPDEPKEEKPVKKSTKEAEREQSKKELNDLINENLGSGTK